MKLAELRGILQYVLQFREKTFVLALDGAVVADDNFATLLLDVALLRSVNIRVVLVHGAGQQIQALAAARGATASDLDGSGVTDVVTLDLAIAASTRLTHEVLGGLTANDLRGACANVITAYPLGILQGVDHQLTGKVERVDVDLVQSLLSQGVVPVIPPLGLDGEGRTYRLNSDRVAVAVAEQVKAIKLIFVTVQDGLVHRGELIRQMLPEQLQELIRDAPDGFAPGLLSKAVHAASAAQAGVPRVHVINGARDEGLLGEVFSNHGLGTLIHVNEYEQIRPARKKDVRAILMLTRQAVEADELVRRTAATIERDLADYFIFEVDRNPVACVALHVYPETNRGELACLYVSTAHEDRGIGRKLIQFVEKRARELGLDDLLVLSTQAFSYFQSKGGFVEGTPDDLPPVRRERYEQSGRRSKVLIKRLGTRVG
jgi:amino-acid N-acetyltransferase